MKGRTLKQENRRIIVGSNGEDVFISFRVVDGDLSPRAGHRVYKNKMVETQIRISLESAKDLEELLFEQIHLMQPRETPDNFYPDFFSKFMDILNQPK